MTQSPYSHYSPYRTKSAEDQPLLDKLPLLTAGNFSPFQSQLANYGAYAGGGGLAGAGIGALIQALRGKSIGKGALIGGGIGTGAGVGLKGLADILAPNAQGIIRDYVRSGYLAGKAKEQDAEALIKYKARTEDTWANYTKDMIFGAPGEMEGDQSAARNAAIEKELTSTSIFKAIREDDQARQGRALGDTLHGLEDWWKGKK